jgi:outer membrane protein OmpA-like peptidoglycan-associated protein
MLGGCAATVPLELVHARSAYDRAATGPAASVSPAELHVASQALVVAERSFTNDGNTFGTRDLAYVAQRKAELAEIQASILASQRRQANSKDEFMDAQGRIVVKTKAELAAAEASGAVTKARLRAEQDARLEAERRAAEAQAALAALNAIKDEPRGLVITLSGSVLFATGETTLLPAALARLDQVSLVLATTAERFVSVEGFTDSEGTKGSNMILSQGRADSVRTYLVAHGYQGNLIQAHGFGEGRPVATNSSAAGRANNRRVEIIIAREAQQSSR